MSGAFASPAHWRWLESETDRLLHFATGALRPSGGFGMLDEVGMIDPDAPIDLLVTCRMTHVFAVGALLGRPGCGPRADHGVLALRHLFRDAANGGWYRQLNPDNLRPTSSKKEAYAHAFVLLAASSAAAAGRAGAAELLKEAANLVEARFWSESEGRSVEAWDTSFGRSEPYRGANSNMHSVEAYLAVADVTGDSRWVDRALRISDWLINTVARANSWRIVEHYHADGSQDREYNADDPAHQYRPYGATIGHAFEWSRLLLHLRAALADDAPDWLLEAATKLYATAIDEGWGVDGAEGFVYTIDWNGAPVVRVRLHWVIAEAINASAALHQATGDAAYLTNYANLWDHVDTYFIDYENGSWHHELDAANQPSGSVWPGKPDVYHALQATLIPRLPLSPSLATALKDGLLDQH